MSLRKHLISLMSKEQLQSELMKMKRYRRRRNDDYVLSWVDPTVPEHWIKISLERFRVHNTTLPERCDRDSL